MLTVPVYNETGTQIGQEQIDERLLGGTVRPTLLKQAVVMYAANRRQGTVAQKTRAEVVGAIDKLIESGALRPHVSRRYSLDEAGQALRDLQERRVLGKVVVEP